MKKNILLTGFLLMSILFFGCSGKLDPTPKMVNISEIKKKMLNNRITIGALSGDSLFDVVARLQQQNKNLIIINKVKESMVFETNLPELSPEEFSKYIKINFNRIIVMRKYSDKIYSIEEIGTKDESSGVEDGAYIIPDKKLKINGSFSYSEAFNILREYGVNLFIDTEKAFDYTQPIGEFTGTIPEFIEFIGSKEKLFAIKTDMGVKFKDSETVTFNLRIPKVNLTPILTTTGASKTASVSYGALPSYNSNNGTSTVINSDTSTSSTNGQYNSQRSTRINTAPTQQGSANTKGSTGTTSPIDDLKKQFATMLEDRGTHSVNLSQGTVAVTGNYDTIKTASRLVKDFNTIYGKGIKLELHVYEVSLDNARSFGVDYSFLKNELVNNNIIKTAFFTTGLSNSLTVDPGSTSAGLVDMSGSVSNGTNVAAARTQNVIFKYLNKFGKATVITKPSLDTINNLPVQLDVTDSIDYVYTLAQTGISTSNTGTTTTSTFNEPEIRTVTTGFSIVLHPKIQGDFINISINNISSILNNLDTYKYGDNNENVIRLKDVSSREFSETVKLKEGEIAIIGGYMYEKKHSSKNGLPYTTGEDSSFDALTSAKETTTEKVEIVITISARVIQ